MELNQGVKINTKYGKGYIAGFNNHMVHINLNKSVMIDKSDTLNNNENDIDAVDIIHGKGNVPVDSILMTRKEVEQWIVDDALADIMVDDLRKTRDRI